MSFDGLFTTFIARELHEKLRGGKINKIHQPFATDLVLQIRNHGETLKLLISAHSTYARLHLTNESFENPAEPPLFCMMLRKHFEGGIIEAVEQVGRERIIALRVRSRNELGDLAEKVLYAEIMGRHSNVIAVDVAKGTIIDSVKHISYAVNRHRAILPGFAYVAPPAQDKLDPFSLTHDALVKRLDFLGGKLADQLVQHIAGLSPLVAKELVARLPIANRETLPAAVLDFFATIAERNEPTYVVSTKEHFTYTALTSHPGTSQTLNSYSELLERFYFGKAERDRVKQQAQDLHRFIENELEKNKKKLTKLEETLAEAERSDTLQLKGELLLAYMHEVKKGMTTVTLDNYYTNEPVTIELRAEKTPAENANLYFTAYQKAKNAVQVVVEQIDKTKIEIDYFDTLLTAMDSAQMRDLAEIREELEEGGYVKRSAKQAKQKKTIEVEQYTLSDGTRVSVGKNNKQNEWLTTKKAGRDEIWLHAKNIPGSHVVIHDEQPSETALVEAAMIAAYFSKARLSGNVPVDYTKIRHVKKPKGTKLGFVIYEQEKTLYVSPSEQFIFSLTHL